MCRLMGQPDEDLVRERDEAVRHRRREVESMSEMLREILTDGREITSEACPESAETVGEHR